MGTILIRSIISLAALCCIMPAVGQNKTVPRDWHLLSHREGDGVFGAEVNRAYELLAGAGKTPLKKVVIALIDTGIDQGHEDLAGRMWTNPGEIPGDGVDNDGNGYADDIHGWNFLGSADGGMILRTSSDIARFIADWGERFAAWYAQEELGHKSGEVRFSEQEELEFGRMYTVLRSSELGNSFIGVQNVPEVLRWVEFLDSEMKKKYPDEEITLEKFSAAVDPNEPDQWKSAAINIISIRMAMEKRSWEGVMEVLRRLPQEQEAWFGELFGRESEDDQRMNAGDDPNDIGDRSYGNNRLTAPNSGHGTFVAGVIGAVRDNGTGIDGIAENVELMILRALPGGSEYDKDIALAIRYAVDNGADIINMSFSSRYSPGAEWVTEALEYAAKKGVLVVRAAGNDWQDTDVIPVYPAIADSKNRRLGNLITVGASTPEGDLLRVSNYGQNSVDVFAPGQDIYSLDMDGNCRRASGTDFATSVVTGISAMLMSYYPDLTPVQVRDIIIETGIIRHGEMVSRPNNPETNDRREQVAFSSAALAGGIVSAYEAVRAAESAFESDPASTVGTSTAAASTAGTDSRSGTDILSLPLKKRYTQHNVERIARSIPPVDAPLFGDIVRNWKRVKGPDSLRQELAREMEKALTTGLLHYMVGANTTQPPIAPLMSDARDSGFPFGDDFRRLMEIWVHGNEGKPGEMTESAVALLEKPVVFADPLCWSILGAFLSDRLLELTDEGQTRSIAQALEQAVNFTEDRFVEDLLSDSLLDFQGKLMLLEKTGKK